MPYFDVIVAPIGTSGDATAGVVGPMSAAQFNTRYGTTPANAGVPGQSNAGFATKAAAQAAATKFNNSGAGKGLNVDPHTPPHLPNPLHGLEAIGNFFSKLGQAATWKRVAEVLLGAALVIVGIAKLAAGTQAGQAAMKIGTKAALL